MPPFRQTTGMMLSLVFLIGGCGDGNDGAQNPPPAPPASPAPPVTPVPPPSAATSGLDARPINKTCIAPAREMGNVTIGTQPAFPNLSFKDPTTFASSQPIAMVQAPRDASRWYVASRVGTVRMFENRTDVSASSVVLDIDARVESSCAECGLLGIAFHPNFPATPRVYLTYTTMQYTDGGPDTHLSEFTSRDGGLTLDPDSERVILRINKPGINHHGGQIAFGPDGFLYFATGDGNVAAYDSAQRLNTLLGKMLRIDISGTTGSALYRIPSDNPLAASTQLCGVNGSGTENCPEIFAWGLRNPWRWSFDRENGDIWLGDVGRTAREEVNRIVRGGNYGWRCLEGTLSTTGMVCDTPANPRPPIAEYDRTFGRAITGGYVYRGTAIPALIGRYVFGDFVSGRIFDIPSDTQPTMLMTGGLESGLSISAFAQDSEGELYVVNIRGDIHRITGVATGTGTDAGTGAETEGVATQLSASGCVNPSDPTQPASGLIPYAPSADFWSDGAEKERWIALPDEQNISVGADGDWDFPNGTVLMKNFRLDNRLIETRLFMRHPDGVWAGYTYEWNAQGNDATLVRGGKQVTLGERTWIYPSESQCIQCHTQAAGGSLGLETKQLAFNITYPQTGRDAHQLVTLNAITVLASPIADPTAETAYPDPSGTAGTLAERARAYLHTNCSQCHRPGGPTTSNMDLRYATALADTNACGVAPALGNLGIGDAQLIAPGASDRSVLPARMSLRGVAEAMPPAGLGSLVDTEGVTLIQSWIDSLSGCE